MRRSRFGILAVIVFLCMVGPAVGSFVPPLDSQGSQTRSAVFALGCFWTAEARFGGLNGVVHEVVGYAGGTTPAPTYHTIGDYREAVWLDYDPQVISYQALLQRFWSSNHHCAPTAGPRYQAVAFVASAEERRQAGDVRAALVHSGKPVATGLILPAGHFFPAEDYHQQYYLRQNGTLLAEFQRYYPGADALARSTAAARVNAWLAGDMPRSDIQALLPQLGLSDAGQQALLAARP